jgi:hypothetical protein
MNNLRIGVVKQKLISTSTNSAYDLYYECQFTIVELSSEW